MSTEYTGNPSNVTTPLARTIIGATNATPIVVQTSSSHGYSTGDYVNIRSIIGNTAANGSWKITSTGLDTFSLYGSVGNGVYSSGGIATDESLTPTMMQPADGDLRSAASVNLAIDLLADRSQWLARKTVDRIDIITASGTWTPGVGTTAVLVTGWGGGGGGGGGGAGASGDAGAAAPGGGGGGSGLPGVHALAVVQATVYTTTIGAGGAGGAAGATGVAGTNGVASSFGSLASFIGGAGGRGGTALSTAVTTNPIAPGGPTPVSGAGQYPIAPVNTLVVNHAFRGAPAGHGGAGAWTDSSAGMVAIGLGGGIPGGGYGGYAGALGANSGAQLGGGGGGGGGGGNGYAANGPLGGTGGGGSEAGVGTNATNGANAATDGGGAGGAGGGGGGSGATGGGAGGAGGNGAAGTLTIRYHGPQAVIA